MGRTRNSPLATWAVNDAYDRPLRLYAPTASLRYFSATWYAPGVERQQRTTLGTDEAGARRWCMAKAAKLLKAQRRRVPDRPVMPGSTLVAEYLNLDNQPDWDSANTIRSQTARARTIVPSRMLDKSCEDWTTEDLRQIVLDAAARGLKRSTLASVRNTLSGIVRVGVDLHYLDADQINMGSVRVPRSAGRGPGKRPGAPHRRDLPDDDGYTFRIERRHLPSNERIAALADALPAPYDTMVRVAAHAGPRWGEIVALRASDVDPVDRTLHITRSAVEAGGMAMQVPKSRRYRDTFYPDFLAEEVEAVRDRAEHDAAHGSGSGLLFPTKEGTVLRRSNFNRRYWGPAFQAAGWQDGWVFHTLRHCAAVWMIYDMDFDIHDVAEVLGHSDPTVTQRIYVQAREGVAARLARRTRSA